MEPLLRVINLSKRFGTLPAVQQVSFDVFPGEVVGLAGSIGSGKSVLVMLLAGLYAQNEGDIYFSNQRLSWPFSAQALGIGIIHQEPDLADRFDVTSNIFLGNEIGWPSQLRWLKIPDRKRMDNEARRLLDQLNVQVNSLREKVANLSGEQRQMLAIARVLTYPVRLVVIDEPTILLSYPYQQQLLSLIQSWRQQGAAVLFSSNNLEHLFAVTDRLIMLHRGRKVADVRTDETSREAVVATLVGAVDQQRPAPTIWNFDSYIRLREQAEKLRYHQMLLEKDLEAGDTLNRQLVEQLAEQVQALDQANLALQEAHRRLLSEREQERKHLARELHDQVIQDLLSINYQLEGLETESPAPEGLKDELGDVRQGIRELVDDLRRICGNLRPPTIDSLGLGAALQSYTHEWSERTGIAIELVLDSNLGRLPETAELSIFRIVQEGLSNIWKHAKATRVAISLEHTSPRTLMVSIGDDGLGFAEDFDLASLSANGHYGLLGISERVALLGGRFRLQRQPGGGALLQVEIPHPRVEVSVEAPLNSALPNEGKPRRGVSPKGNRGRG
ncbi:MAG: ATP-binding cassette domain-containing protein [Anaerolineales bacterium]|nr:ATP-binding cassette domain-containing protein [Anaerolineales bacterium]